MQWLFKHVSAASRASIGCAAFPHRLRSCLPSLLIHVQSEDLETAASLRQAAALYFNHQEKHTFHVVRSRADLDCPVHLVIADLVCPSAFSVAPTLFDPGLRCISFGRELT